MLSLKGSSPIFIKGYEDSSQRGTHITRSRAFGSYLTQSNDKKKRNKGNLFIMHIMEPGY